MPETNKPLLFLNNIVKNYKIFIDTCSILDDNSEKFWKNITPILQKENKHIIIPRVVIEEIQKFAKNYELCAKKGDPSLHDRSRKVLKQINDLKTKGFIQIYGDPDDKKIADQVFRVVFTRFQMDYNMILITQDKGLANDILKIDDSKSIEKTKHRISVRKINRQGYLSIFNFENHPSPSYDKNEIPDESRFAFATNVKKVNGKLTISFLPGEGDSIVAVRGKKRETIKLLKSISSGGEGTIYETNRPNYVAKIYKREKLDCAKYEKISLMMTKTIDCEGVCFPLAMLYNTKEEFVGYLMQQARGKELQKCVFLPQLLRKNFPHWTKKDTVTLCITILKKLIYLHDCNIILGDINPNNILVVSPKEVYFVDADSYQIEGFPCPVGTINFTAPEIQKKNFSSFLRTRGNERFAVATLLFMIMLPGKPPYSLQGGENQIENILNGDFAYASGIRSTGKAPAGPWRFCWSHLPRYLKDDFYETFHKNGKRYLEKNRFSSSDWLQKFTFYLNLLENGTMEKQDSMSLSIFPTRLKKSRDIHYIYCKLCKNEVKEDSAEQGICRDCLNKCDSVYKCSQCGCDIKYTNYQKYIKHSPKFDLCKDCFNKRNMVYTIKTCTECGKKFEIKNGEKEFYEEKGFQLPKKCKDCRNNSTSPSRSSQSSSTNNGSWCFITTAVCEYLKKADNCYELTMLRQFRDNWLILQPGGRLLVQEYYQIAPSIVNALNISKDRDEIYYNIWKSYIQPCVSLIEQKSFESCQTLYEEMVHYLKQTVLKEN